MVRSEIAFGPSVRPPFCVSVAPSGSPSCFTRQTVNSGETMLVTRVLALLLVIGFGTIASADTVTVIDFEGLVEGASVTTQFSGLTLSNATVLAAGTTLDEFEFPQHSGLNVVFDDLGPITITFSSPVLAVGGYFDYFMPLTLQAYDAGDNLLGSVTSAFLANLGLSGDMGSAPNEFLQL